MKILVLVACLLTISYAGDPQILKAFYDNYDNCRNELNVPEWAPEIIKCILQHDELIDEQGIIKKEELFTRLEDLISDETNLSQAKEIISTCYDQVYQGPGSNDEKIITTIQCSIHVNDLLDKRQ